MQASSVRGFRASADIERSTLEACGPIFPRKELLYRFTPQFDYDIRRLLLQVRIDLAVASAVDHFDEVHQVPLRYDILGRDDGLVLVFPPCRTHIEGAVILILADAAIAQANGFDPG